MNGDRRPARSVIRAVLAFIGCGLEFVSIVLAGEAGRRSAEAGDGPVSDADAASAHRGLFDGEEKARTAYTIYGREPVTAGRDGKPVGSYSGAPIIHY